MHSGDSEAVFSANIPNLLNLGCLFLTPPPPMEKDEDVYLHFILVARGYILRCLSCQR